MKKVGLLIDSTSLTSKEFTSYDFIKVVQLKVDIEQVEYKESQLSKEQMLENIDNHLKMKTSQPAPTEFLDAYQAFYDQGYQDVLVIVLSDKISGTFQSAMLAKTMFESDLNISVHSPESASFGIANGLRILAQYMDSGHSFDDVLKKYYKVFDKTHVSFTLENLKHLFIGGRLSRISALIGTVLRIKPIVEIVEGKLKMVKKERTNGACLNFFMEKIDSYADEYKELYIDVIYLGMEKWANKLVESIKKKYPNAHIHVTDYVSPVFYVHLGDKGFGVAIIGLNE